jgi:hypothetical protein
MIEKKDEKVFATKLHSILHIFAAETNETKI